MLRLFSASFASWYRARRADTCSALAGDDPNALAVFVSVLTGPPGPKPEDLLTDMQQPVLILWGDQDKLTPLDVRTHFRVPSTDVFSAV